MKKKIAVIDVGTNSCLLTIVDREPPPQAIQQGKPVASFFKGERIPVSHPDKEVRSRPTPIIEKAEITRLGEGLIHSKKLTSNAMQRTLRVISEYKDLCTKHSVENIHIIGTAAMRKAENANKFQELVKKNTGLSIEIISGQKEAELVFASCTHDFGNDISVIDIGGGSTEIIYRTKSVLHAKSLDIGSVVLHENFVHTDPISLEDFQNLYSHIQKHIKKESIPSCDLIATAGTATTLAAIDLGLSEYDHEKVQGHMLTLKNLEIIIDNLQQKTIAERKHISGLEPKRADIILSGALILEIFMKETGFTQVKISDRGVRWGLIFSQFTG